MTAGALREGLFSTHVIRFVGVVSQWANNLLTGFENFVYLL